MARQHPDQDSSPTSSTVLSSATPLATTLRVYLITSELGGEHAGHVSWVIYLRIIHIKISKVVTYWPGLPFPVWLPKPSSVSLLCEQFPL